MKHTDPRDIYPKFYNNPTIKVLGAVPRWTVSDSESVPVNFKALVASGNIWGAHEVNEECLVTLDTISRDLPPAANCTFYLQSDSDGVALLTVNTNCPPELAHRLISLSSLYGEYQGSGPGCQFLFPLPTNFHNFPSIRNRKVLVEEHGWYELTFEGWVTFSRNTLRNDQPQVPVEHHLPSHAWDELFASLAQKTRRSRVASPTIRLAGFEVPRMDQILVLITGEPLQRSIRDFHGDYALYEHWVLAELYTRLQPVLRIMQDLEPDLIFNDAVQAWLLFEGASRVLEHRPYDPDKPDRAPLLRAAAVSLVTHWPLFENAST